MAVVIKTALLCLLLLAATGCSTTYVPVSWGMGEKVQQMSRKDFMLNTLFERYDPQRKTLRVEGDSFEQVMMPSEVKSHLGAYRPDTRLIYRNLYYQYQDHDLRDLMVHELAHHIWYSAMSAKQREQWRQHLVVHPSPLQKMVRHIYQRPSDYDTEDFAYTVEYARTTDIEELAVLNLITVEERDEILIRQAKAEDGDTPPDATTQPAKKGGRDK